MAASVDWDTKVITVFQADLTLISGTKYEYDVNTLRRELDDLLDDEGMPFLDTHQHITSVDLSGVTYARFFIIINGYTITFEDGAYSVTLFGANHNIMDVLNDNQVSVLANNSAGLTVPLTATDIAAAVWDAATSAHQIAGSTGEALADAELNARRAFQVGASGA